MPPNTLAAEMATIPGRKTKAALATISRKPYQSLDANPGSALPRASTRPIMRPDATIAGRIGTNTSPIGFSSFFQSGCFSAAAALTSSLVAAVMPVIARNSSYTLLTVPVPMMSCSCPLDSNMPLTPSTSSRYALSTLLLSLMTRRSLVAQCAACATFSRPPI